jgi:curli biogenesis system outer membrane secretion channel CsgG
MNVLKLTLVIAALLCIAILSGCQQGYSQETGLHKADRIAYQPTGTGFWRPSQ